MRPSLDTSEAKTISGVATRSLSPALCLSANFISILSVCLRVYLPVWFLLISGKDCPSVSLCLPSARTRVLTVIPSVRASYVMHVKTPYVSTRAHRGRARLIEADYLVIQVSLNTATVKVLCQRVARKTRKLQRAFKNTQTVLMLNTESV